MIPDLFPGEEGACKNLVVLDLNSGAVGAHTTVSMMEGTVKLDVCTSEGQSLSGLPAPLDLRGHVFITRELLESVPGTGSRTSS